MDDNPYAPPESDLTPDHASSNSSVEPSPVAWRDGELIVVGRKPGRLPFFCVEMGAPVTQLIPYTLGWKVRSRARPFLGFGGEIESQLFYIGISRPGRILRMLFPCILFCVFLFLGGYNAKRLFFPVGLEAKWPPYPLGTVVLSLFGMAAAIGMAVKPPLKVVRSNMQFAWLSGANPEFLRLLPSWAPGGRTFAVDSAGKRR